MGQEDTFRLLESVSGSNSTICSAKSTQGSASRTKHLTPRTGRRSLTRERLQHPLELQVETRVVRRRSEYWLRIWRSKLQNETPEHVLTCWNSSGWQIGGSKELLWERCVTRADKIRPRTAAVAYRWCAGSLEAVTGSMLSALVTPLSQQLIRMVNLQ